jgi:hypothetical protein
MSPGDAIIHDRLYSSLEVFAMSRNASEQQNFSESLLAVV